MKSHVTKEEIRSTNKHKKGCPTSLPIKEMQIKTGIRYYYTPIKMAKIKI